MESGIPAAVPHDRDLQDARALLQRLSYQTGMKQELSGGDFSGRLGLVYLADNGDSAYVSHSESFTPQAGADADGNSFVPTTGRQIEAEAAVAAMDDVEAVGVDIEPYLPLFDGMNAIVATPRER